MYRWFEDENKDFRKRPGSFGSRIWIHGNEELVGEALKPYREKMAPATKFGAADEVENAAELLRSDRDDFKVNN